MVNKPMECQACGEIMFEVVGDDGNCGACGHYENHSVSAFEKWALELGYDKIDLFGKLEAMKLAFDAGRGFEAEVTTAQLKLINESLQDSPMAKKQA